MTDDLFDPLTPPNPAATRRKCKRHQYRIDMYQDDPDSRVLAAREVCRRCGSVRDEERSRRGRTNRQRGNAIEREMGKRLGLARVGQYGGPDDLRGEMFAAQVKSGGAFSERLWGWLKAVPVKAGQTAILVVADTPGPGKRRRAMVMLDIDDWVDLHGDAK
ncbi:MAG: hypothetical protein IT345_10750 [Trueperaceae bacterium]|nr:hypothetical protein [Trueperaceae bacterium]